MPTCTKICSKRTSQIDTRAARTQSQVWSHVLGRSSANAFLCLRGVGVRGVEGTAWRGVESNPSSVPAGSGADLPLYVIFPSGCVQSSASFQQGCVRLRQIKGPKCHDCASWHGSKFSVSESAAAKLPECKSVPHSFVGGALQEGENLCLYTYSSNCMSKWRCFLIDRSVRTLYKKNILHLKEDI